MTKDVVVRGDLGLSAHPKNENNATSTGASNIPMTVLMKALEDVQSAAVQIHPDHFATNERGELQLMILIQYEGLSVLHTLNKEERNYLVRKNPTLLAACLANAQRQMVDQRGFRYLENCLITWAPSFIPFHLVYTISRSKLNCQHLVSIRSLETKSAKRYAEALIPLAKAFLIRPYGSRPPHLPFIWGPASSSSPEILDPADSKAQRTFEHGQLITTQFKTLKELDIATAEATAKLINENKIIPGLLELIFDPGPKKVGPPQIDNVLSGDNRVVGAHSSDKRLKILGPAMGTSEKEDITTSDRTEYGVKKAGLVEPDQKISVAKKKKRINASKVDCMNGIMEPVEAASSAILSQNSQVVGSDLIHSEGSENAPAEAGEAASVKPAKSRRKLKKSRTQPIMAPAIRMPLGKKDNGTSEVEPRVPYVTGDSAQTSFSSECDDGVVTNHRTESTSADASTDLTPETAGLRTSSSGDISAASFQDTASSPERSHDCPVPTLSLPPPAFDVQTLVSPRKRALEEEVHDLMRDLDDDRNVGTHHYWSNNEPLSNRASTAKKSPILAGEGADTKPSALASERGIQELQWTYATYTDGDEALLSSGVWLWDRPPTYFYPHQVSINMSNPYVLAPVIVSHESTGTSFPLIEYSGEVVHIIPHDEPWEDVRSLECHPDFLPPCKLVEYQACEAAGYYVWRHDRDHLPCRKPDCEAFVADYDRYSVFCLGCGPKSIVRYCSFQHQIEDVKDHWSECGDPSLLMQCVIDHATEPAYFSSKPPEIENRYGFYGFRSAELQRQKIYFMNNGGYYTLFDPLTQDAKTLSWSKTNPNRQDLDGRIERLLNVAFFGARKRGFIRYIYRLLRELLLCAGKWTEQNRKCLETQIRAEVNYSGRLEDSLAKPGDDGPCECEWTGGDIPSNRHRSTCKWRHEPTLGLNRAAFRPWVERMENKYWILRAWRQQHPMEKDWRVRANGYGIIPLQPGEEIYRLGSGWTGWGGREDNCRGPDGSWDVELRERFDVS